MFPCPWSLGKVALLLLYLSAGVQNFSVSFSLNNPRTKTRRNKTPAQLNNFNSGWRSNKIIIMSKICLNQFEDFLWSGRFLTIMLSECWKFFSPILSYILWNPVLLGKWRSLHLVYWRSILRTGVNNHHQTTFISIQITRKNQLSSSYPYLRKLLAFSCHTYYKATSHNS